ncbi:PTS sugar transporter subunit IIA [Schumannella sp. 10F1B-5-1]|uniref:PTS sugar transporter subunit IIA n=1 Tax=Schumannella sp. 10F1B-5-1 TaxID=2590780 RepID=UPI001131BBBF|nr:PTS sugar transporter subunit IIA [Schumannella sp. 10F1B-5-1]TPW71576.1 PTS sugar transporter subunit IIA [Schumannella sp. 10F1B-5-1]
MLSDNLTPERIQFAENVDGWRTAVEQVAAPLLADGSIEPGYVTAMTDSIANGGTYIDLGFGIALAHARPEAGVNRTGLSYLRVTPAVLLNDEAAHPIDLFLCLAATDPSGHLETMQELAGLLTDAEQRDALLAATTPAEVSAVIHQNGHE